MVQWSNMTATILITEDEEFLASILNSKLIKAGYKTVKAKDGDEAIRFAIETKPDLILLDLMIPVMDGFEVLRKLKDDPILKNIKVIVMSNLGQDEDIQKAKNLGAADYLVKSNHSIQEMVACVGKHLSK